VAWEKPATGLDPVQGHRDHNLVFGPGIGGSCRPSGFAVFLDPLAPTDQRFRMTQHPKELGKNKLHIYSSGDGIHWRLTHRNIIDFDSDARLQLDSNNPIFRDTRLGRYTAYVRRNLHRHGQDRGVVRAEAERLDRFPPLMDFRVVLRWEAGIDAARGDMPLTDWYCSNVVPYPDADDAYYMFPSIYYHFERGAQPGFRERAPVNGGLLDLRFGASRDGIAWQRFDRRPYVSLGLRGEWDGMRHYGVYGLVPSPDRQKLYLYYVGRNDPHAWASSDENRDLFQQAGFAPEGDAQHSGIGRLVVRRDGFIAAAADYTGGRFRTPLLRFSGNRLELNVNTGAAGELKAALLDEAGKPIPGFTLEGCDLVYGANELARVLTWAGRRDLSPLAGRPVRLHVEMRDTDLFAFQFSGKAVEVEHRDSGPRTRTGR
jgi:hypothetical protein